MHVLDRAFGVGVEGAAADTKRAAAKGADAGAGAR